MFGEFDCVSGLHDNGEFAQSPKYLDEGMHLNTEKILHCFYKMLLKPHIVYIHAYRPMRVRSTSLIYKAQAIRQIVYDILRLHEIFTKMETTCSQRARDVSWRNLKTQQSLVTLEFCLSETRARKLYDYRDVIVFESSVFQNVFHPH